MRDLDGEGAVGELRGRRRRRSNAAVFFFFFSRAGRDQRRRRVAPLFALLVFDLLSLFSRPLLLLLLLPAARARWGRTSAPSSSACARKDSAADTREGKERESAALETRGGISATLFFRTAVFLLLGPLLPSPPSGSSLTRSSLARDDGKLSS